MKIRPEGTELFYTDRHTDRRTDMTTLIVVFCNFAKAPTRRRVFTEPYELIFQEEIRFVSVFERLMI